MSKRRLLLELAVLLILIAVYAVVMWRPLQAPTKADYDRVLYGMTRAEVEHLLGPPGDYRSWATVVEFRPLPIPPTMHVDWWGCDEGVIAIEYTDDRVVGTYFREDFRELGVFQKFIWEIKYGSGSRASR